jgi:hypothetical protein
VAQHEQRRLVGAVHVVEDDQQRRVRGGAQGLDHVVEQPEPLLGRLPAAVASAGAGALGPAERVVAPERAQHLPPRPVGGRALDLGAAAPRHGHALRPRLRGQLLGQAGLADPGLACAQRQPPATVAGGGQPARQRLQLPAAPDQVRVHIGSLAEVGAP